jgi:hypothetical protein
MITHNSSQAPGSVPNEEDILENYLNYAETEALMYLSLFSIIPEITPHSQGKMKGWLQAKHDRRCCTEEGSV